MTKLSKFYNKEEMKKMVEARYLNCIPPIRLTLKRIVPTKSFQSLKNSLRSQGWKDWHILMGLFNYVLNYRMRKMGISGNLTSMIKFQETYTYQEENENSIFVTLDEFTEKNLKVGLESSMPATISALGLNLPKNTAISKEKIRTILDKFNYWIDDADHQPIFDL